MAATLNHILNMGSESLHNSRVGVDVTGHNIANAHTPGFSRQRVQTETRHPAQYGAHVLGQGAKIQTIERVHDKFLETQWRKEIQGLGAGKGENDGLARLEGLFSPEMTSTVRDRMTTFYNSMREFANYPDEPAVRISLVENANTFVSAINATHAGIAEVQDDLTAEIESNVSIVNQKLQEVASLNQSIKEMEVDQASRANDLEDRRDLVVRELAGLVDTQAYKDANDQITLRGPGGVLLVEGNKASTFESELDDSKGIYSRLVIRDAFGQSARDVTGDLKLGRMAGLVRVRDHHAQSLRDDVNRMASSLGEAFNAIHRQGFGQGEYARVTGRDFFEGLEAGGEPARTMRVSTLIANEPDAIAAAMTPDASGDNVIANKLVKLFYEPIVATDANTVSLAQHYDNVVARLGVDTLHVRESMKASQIVVAQIEAQREAASGVSLDEEAANLLKYQHLFTASSRIITTADEMFRTVLDLKR